MPQKARTYCHWPVPWHPSPILNSKSFWRGHSCGPQIQRDDHSPVLVEQARNLLHGLENLLLGCQEQCSQRRLSLEACHLRETVALLPHIPVPKQASFRGQHKHKRARGNLSPRLRASQTEFIILPAGKEVQKFQGCAYSSAVESSPGGTRPWVSHTHAHSDRHIRHTRTHTYADPQHTHTHIG